MLGLGYYKDYLYLMTAFIAGTHWSNFLKPMLHHSRPQFDDPVLGEINVGDCAGEFGNPSGHSLLVSQFLLTFWWLYRKRLTGYFSPKYIMFTDLLVVMQIFTMCLCRLYLGRHSLD